MESTETISTSPRSRARACARDDFPLAVGPTIASMWGPTNGATADPIRSSDSVAVTDLPSSGRHGDAGPMAGHRDDLDQRSGEGVRRGGDDVAERPGAGAGGRGPAPPPAAPGVPGRSGAGAAKWTSLFCVVRPDDTDGSRLDGPST